MKTAVSRKLYLPIFGLVSTTLFVGLVLSCAAVSADDDSVVDEIEIAVPTSCTMSGAGMSSHTAEINAGLYEDDIGSTTLHAFCNDADGFAIYAVGYTGDEMGGTNSTKLVGTNASGNATIDSGLATTAGNPDVSNWAMKLAITQDSGDTTGTNAFAIDSAPNTSGGADASFSSYHVVPSEYTKVAHKNSNTNMTAVTGGVKLTTTYAAYISRTQPADTYTGQVKYVLVHPSSAGDPSSVACNPSGTTIGTNTSTDVQCMQDISSANKSSVMTYMATDAQYTLKDKRDGKEYKVAKLADDRVWMTQNLDLDIDSSKTYTNEDTDLGWNGTSYSTASWTPIRSTYTATANHIHEWCAGGTISQYTGTCVLNDTPESYDPGDLYWNGTISDFTDWSEYYGSCDFYTDPPTCYDPINPLPTYTTLSGSPTPQYHLGNYYNWAAAIASNDAGIYGAYNETTGEYENLTPDQSICPAGWTLPHTNHDSNSNIDTGDFVDLLIEYGWDTYTGFDDISVLWSAPLYFTPAGYFNACLLLYTGNEGYFWASNTTKNQIANNMYYDAFGDARLANGLNRDNGNSVRCLLR